jgi:hypothetical protein
MITTAVKTEPDPPIPSTMTADRMVEKYIALRDKVGEIKKRHAAELERYHTVMDTLEAMLLDVLNQHQANSMRVEGGTFYKSTRSTPRVTNWQAALSYIREHEAWDLLEARVAKNAAQAVIEETKAGIPGVEVTRETVVHVRRA